MKKLLSIAIFLFALASINNDTLAQITITSTDISAMNAVGNTIINHSDTTTMMINIGTPGSTTWDFSSLHSHTNFTLASVVPSSSPFYSVDFPTSNVVFRFRTLELGDSAQVWQYSTQNSGEYLMNGLAAQIIFDTDTILLKEIYTPASAIYKLPFTFNSQWTNNYTVTTSTIFGGLPISTDVQTHTESVVVDAWGNLKLPGGAVVQALRVRTDHRITAPGFKDRQISYSFITKSGPAVSVNATDTTESNSGVIHTDGVNWSNIASSVGIAESKPASRYSLLQNKPNPVIVNTNILYSIGDKQLVTLKVYNHLGAEVATLVNERKEAGDYEVFFDASYLSPGSYYYKLIAGNYSETKKMIIIR
jgi:hypothetical protein